MISIREFGYSYHLERVLGLLRLGLGGGEGRARHDRGADSRGLTEGSPGERAEEACRVHDDDGGEVLLCGCGSARCCSVAGVVRRGSGAESVQLRTKRFSPENWRTGWRSLCPDRWLEMGAGRRSCSEVWKSCRSAVAGGSLAHTRDPNALMRS